MWGLMWGNVRGCRGINKNPACRDEMQAFVAGATQCLFRQCVLVKLDPVLLPD